MHLGHMGSSCALVLCGQTQNNWLPPWSSISIESDLVSPDPYVASKSLCYDPATGIYSNASLDLFGGNALSAADRARACPTPPSTNILLLGPGSTYQLRADQITPQFLAQYGLNIKTTHLQLISDDTPRFVRSVCFRENNCFGPWSNVKVTENYYRFQISNGTTMRCCRRP